MPNPSFFSPRLQERGFTPGTSMLGQNTQPPFTLLDILGNQQGPAPALEDLKTMLLEPGGHPPLFPSLQEGTTPEEKISGMMFDFMPGGGVGGEIAGGLLGQTLYQGAARRFAGTEKNPFGEFMRRFIGTGEGSAYRGYGYYLAEAKGTAITYKRVNERKKEGGLRFKALTDQENAGLRSVTKEMVLGKRVDPAGKPFDLDGIVDLFEDRLQALQPDFGTPILGHRRSPAEIQEEVVLKREISALKKLKRNGAELDESTKPVLLTVEFPDKEVPRLLDWDEALYRQVPEMRPGLRKLESMVPEIRASSFAKLGPLEDSSFPAGDLVRWGERNFGREKFADMLSDAGIPGLKFFDQLSRAAGKGTRNYVIFPGNERLLTITEVE